MMCAREAKVDTVSWGVERDLVGARRGLTRS